MAFDCAIKNNLGGKVISIDFSSELFLWDKVSKVALIGELNGHFHSFTYTMIDAQIQWDKSLNIQEENNWQCRIVYTN